MGKNLRRLSGLRRELGVYPYLATGFFGGLFLIGGIAWEKDWLSAVSASVIAGSIVAFFQVIWEDRLAVPATWGIGDIFSDRLQSFSDDDWREIVRSANKSFRVLGWANHGYVNKGNKQIFKELFTELLRTRKSLEIEILWIDPEWSAIIQAKDDEEERTTSWDLLDAILTFADEIRSPLPPGDQSRIKLKKYRAIPTCGITWVDESFMVVTHYLTHKDNLNAPGFTLYRYRTPSMLQAMNLTAHNRSLYDVYRENFEYVAGRPSTSEITAQDIDRYRGLKQQLESATQPIISEENRREEATND